MAGDWMPMRLDLCEDPAVMAIADALNMREEFVVGCLHRIWSWASRQCHTGIVTNITLASLARVTNLPDFVTAMKDAGWIEEDVEQKEDGTIVTFVRFPNWDRWMSNSAKKRLNDTERQRNSRKSSAKTSLPNVTSVSHSERDKVVTKEEKRTEEKKKKSSRKNFEYSESFLRWFEIYPRSEGKLNASKAFEHAIEKISKERSISNDEAVAWLVDRTTAMRPHLLKSELQYRPHPATWLSNARYDDELTQSGDGSRSTHSCSPDSDPHARRQARIEKRLSEASTNPSESGDKPCL